MNAPWFDPNAWAWLPGTVLGCLGGIWGSVAGFYAPRGQARRLVFGGGILLAVLAVASGVAGVVALAKGQPYGVWYGLLLPAVIALFVVPTMLPQVVRRYREAEARRISAEDL